ncbi:MAG TPA: hypothetical protein VK954_07505 [Methyloradius sp.]|uniref:hypothetical protein n=1 Tax=Methylophilus sp. TaxID=29541 RepID=UPI002B770DB9|nr:hypothetical protein [Methylophilus sp.]HSH87464.1 hypothetical protein [Methylophilus sp.]HSH98123.1 hypothetical protein [Methyloradius sp.]
MENQDNLFEEYYKSARDLILERFSSPLFFSFIISWLITNYRIVITVLSDQTAEFNVDYKFWLVQQYLNIWDGFAYPLVAALAYVFLYPHIDLKITEYLLNRAIEKRNSIHDIEKTQTRTAAEVAAIHLRHYKVESELRKEIENLRITEQQLREKISSFETTPAETPLEPSSNTFVDEPLVKSESSDIRWEAEELDTIKTLGTLFDNGDEYVEFENIVNYSQYSHSAIRLALLNLVEHEYVDNNPTVYWLTKKGLTKYQDILKNASV